MIDKILEPFDEKIRFRKLFMYWILFFSIGFALKQLITPLSPAFIESEKQIVENFCIPIGLLEVIVAPILETLVFMIFPFKFFGKRGASICLVIWASLHLIGRNFPTFAYISVMSIFYYKAVSSKKFKEIILLHGIPNWLAILTCLL